MTTTTYRGPLVQAPNLSADATGSIHDDAQAQKLGFGAGLVGGSVLCAFLGPALIEQFGPAWYERGFIQQSFLRPVYTTDEFRVAVDPLAAADGDEVLIAIGLEKRTGEQATAGYAGVAKSAARARTPWERLTPAAKSVAGDEPDPLPGEPIGTRYPPRTVRYSPADSAARRAAAGDGSRWYTEESPWGGPIVPSFLLLLEASTGARLARADGATRTIGAGMNATFQLLHSAPLRCGELYEVATTLVEKGYSGRTAYRTTELQFTDADGTRAAILRQKVRWFPQAAG